MAENLLVRLALDARDYVRGAQKARGATDDITDAQKKTEKAGNRLSVSLDEVGRTLVAAFAARKVLDFAKTTIAAFSNLEESVNAVNVQFEEGSGVIKDFARDAATSVGLSTASYQQLSVTTGALLSNFIEDNRAAAEETNNLTQRAADLASVFNTDVEEALVAVQAAIRGESEPIRRFGVLLDDVSVRAKAVALGLAETTKEVDNQAKAQARLAIIYEQTDKVAGDFVNTADSLANVQKVLAAEFENAQAEVGEALAPALLELLGIVNDNLIPAMVDLIPLVVELVKAFGAFLDLVEPGIALVGRFAQDLGALVQSFSEGNLNAVQFNKALNLIVTTQRKGGDGAVAFANAISNLTDNLILDADSLRELAAATNFVGDQQGVAIQLALEDARARGVVADQIAVLEDALLSEVNGMDLNTEARLALIDSLGLGEAAAREAAAANELLQASLQAGKIITAASQEAQREAWKETQTAENRARSYAEATQRLADAADGARKRFEGEADAIRDVAKAQAEAANPLLRVLRAQEDVTAAQDALAEIQKEGKPAAEDLRDANLDLLEAQLGLEGATANAADKIQDGGDALFDLAEQVGISEEVVRELIAALDDLPTSVVIDFETRFTESGRRQVPGSFLNRAEFEAASSRRHGGDFDAFQPIRVGEAGVETLIPRTAGTIIAGQPGGGTTIQIFMEGNGDQFDDTQLALAMAGIVEDIEFGGDSTLRG